MCANFLSKKSARDVSNPGSTCCDESKKMTIAQRVAGKNALRVLTEKYCIRLNGFCVYHLLLSNKPLLSIATVLLIIAPETGALYASHGWARLAEIVAEALCLISRVRLSDDAADCSCNGKSLSYECAEFRVGSAKSCWVGVV